MISHTRAIDIALAKNGPESGSGHIAVVPVMSTESLVASRGLGIHIEKVYDAVYKKAAQEKALEVVFNFLSDDAEKFLQRARNLQRAIDPESQISGSRAYAAAGISYLLRGQRAHKTGVWLKGEAGDDQLKRFFYEIQNADTLTFHEYAEWGHKQSARNEIYWKRQIEGLRGSYHINLLAEKIDESDHYLFEV